MTIARGNERKSLTPEEKKRKLYEQQKAKKWLEESSIAFEGRHIKEDNPTAEELKTWQKRSGLPPKKSFNNSGLQYKVLQLKDKLATMSEDAQFALLASDGMLVNRPLLIGKDFVLVSFKEADWASTLKK